LGPEEPEDPKSGNFRVWLSPGLHRGAYPGVTGSSGLEAPITISLPLNYLPQIMHKWNLRFNAEPDTLSLIALLEEKIATYGFDPKEVKRAGSVRTAYLVVFISKGIPEFLLAPPIF